MTQGENNQQNKPNGTGQSGPVKRKVAKTTTRPTKAQERKDKIDVRKSLLKEKAAAKAAFGRGKHDGGKSRKPIGEVLRDPSARKRIFRTILAVLILLCVAAIATVVLLHRNMEHERISSEGYFHDERFADCLVVDGIDVSFAQGEDIDWDKVKQSGVDFVFIRAGFRGAESGKLNEDSEFIRNIEGAQDAGLMVGVYFYSQAVTAREAREEAQFVLALVEPYDITLPLVMDYEVYPGGRLEKAYETGLLTPTFMNNVAMEFCRTVEAKGYQSAVYANYYFLTTYLDGASLGGSTDVWLAHYTDATDYPEAYRFWQCSGAETVPGIPGEVDKDFWYLDLTPEADGTASVAADLSGRTSVGTCAVTLKKTKITYYGKPVRPGVTVTLDGKRLSEGRDYLVSYVKNTEPGTGYVVVTGIGNYTGRQVQSFEIGELWK